MKISKLDNLLALILLVIIVLVLLCLLAGLTLGIMKLAFPENDTETQPPTDPQTTTDGSQPTDVPPAGDLYLGESQDAGMAYIDKMIFFGESTTSHLASRGVLSEGTDTKQVWTDASGTRMLSSRITSEPIKYPPTGESLTIGQACEREQPAYLVLSFGLNGLESFIADEASYTRNYGKLIAAVQAASPDTKIILQTVYPVRSQGNFNADVDTLNRHINRLNALLPGVAAGYANVRVADTASVLTNEEGCLDIAYDNGDGIHLTASAYEAVLDYLRKHAWN